MQGKSVKLISIANDQEGNPQLRLHKEGIRTIEQGLPVEFASVGIVGEYRAGKSRFLNFMTRPQHDVFEVSHNSEPCTKGIDIYIEQCGTRNVLLLDTEGLYDTSSSDEQDNKLFALLALISSTLIVNVDGKFKKSTFDDLVKSACLLDVSHIKEKDQQLYFVVQKDNLVRQQSDNEFLEDKIRQSNNESLLRVMNDTFPNRQCKFLKPLNFKDEETVSAAVDAATGILNEAHSGPFNGKDFVAFLKIAIDEINNKDIGQIAELYNLNQKCGLEEKIEEYKTQMERHFAVDKSERPISSKQLSQFSEDLLRTICERVGVQLFDYLQGLMRDKTDQILNHMLKELDAKWVYYLQPRIQNSLHSLLDFFVKVPDGDRFLRDVDRVVDEAWRKFCKTYNFNNVHDKLTLVGREFARAATHIIIRYTIRTSGISRTNKQRIKAGLIIGGVVIAGGMGAVLIGASPLTPIIAAWETVGMASAGTGVASAGTASATAGGTVASTASASTAVGVASTTACAGTAGVVCGTTVGTAGSTASATSFVSVGATALESISVADITPGVAIGVLSCLLREHTRQENRQ